LLWNCEKDEIINAPEKEKSLFVQNRIDISKIPEIKQLLPTQLRGKYKNKTHKLNEAIFDEENILEVIDTLNFKNYSFRFTLPNSKIGEFYNLVIGKDAEGNLAIPIVLKYVCDDGSLNDFISNKFSLRYFNGEISKHRYTDYFEKGYFDKTSTNCPPTLDGNGDPVPCETIKADGSVSGGGITSAPNVGSSGTGTTSTNCISFTVEVLCSCEGHYVGEQCTCGQNGNSGQAAYYDVWTYCITQEQKSASKTDCPPCSINSDGLVGINTIEIASLRTKLINSIRGINDGQINWINNDDNTVAFLNIITFLNQNADLSGNWTSEAINHALESMSIFTELNNIRKIIEAPTFNALDSPWLKALRELAKKIEQLKNSGNNLWKILNQYLDTQLIKALNTTAKNLYPEVSSQYTEKQKEDIFKTDGKKAVAILLYEFANGLGKDLRTFTLNHNVTHQMLSGNVISDIKADFNNVLNKEGITFDQFKARNKPLGGGYAFSPDHTGVLDSFNKHINANWVQFFVGGTSTKYYPSNEPGWIIVEMTNPTSRNSLLLHIGDEYKRDGTNSGDNKPLSTINQIFRFKLKIP